MANVIVVGVLYLSVYLLVGNGICSSIGGDGGWGWWFLNIGGDGGLVVVVIMVTTGFKGGSFSMEELLIFILCGGICGVGSGYSGVCNCCIGSCLAHTPITTITQCTLNYGTPTYITTATIMAVVRVAVGMVVVVVLVLMVGDEWLLGIFYCGIVVVVS